MIGKERSEARKAFLKVGLEPVVEEEETSVPGQVGRVLDQFPPPGHKLEPGAEVTIVGGRQVPKKKTDPVATEGEGERA